MRGWLQAAREFTVLEFLRDRIDEDGEQTTTRVTVSGWFLLFLLGVALLAR